MEVPPTPSSLYDFTATLQSLKHTKQVLLQYLQVPTMVMIQKQSIPLQLYEELFAKADTDCDPYETVIECVYSILSLSSLH